MDKQKTSGHSIEDATNSRASFSGHGTNSLGAAGFISPHDEEHKASFLSSPGQTAIINPPKDGMDNFEVGVAWDNISKKGKILQPKQGLLNKLLKKSAPTNQKSKGVDLDIGCLYEMENGEKGAIQAFGEMFGSLEIKPFIHLSGDERTGDAEGEDEVLTINGAHWKEFKRVLLYIYIYDGASNWNTVQPQIQVRVPTEDPMVVTLKAHREELALCAVAKMENVRGGIRMTNIMEYFPGHAEMDRAFGYGLQWADGQK